MLCVNISKFVRSRIFTLNSQYQNQIVSGCNCKYCLEIMLLLLITLLYSKPTDSGSELLYSTIDNDDADNNRLNNNRSIYELNSIYKHVLLPVSIWNPEHYRDQKKRSAKWLCHLPPSRDNVDAVNISLLNVTRVFHVQADICTPITAAY